MNTIVIQYEYHRFDLAMKNRRGNNMQETKLIIEPKKYKEESVVVSVRIPRDMLKDIDSVANEAGRTRNEIITLFLDYALKNTEIIEKN